MVPLAVVRLVAARQAAALLVGAPLGVVRLVAARQVGVPLAVVRLAAVVVAAVEAVVMGGLRAHRKCRGCSRTSCRPRCSWTLELRRIDFLQWRHNSDNHHSRGCNRKKVLDRSSQPYLEVHRIDCRQVKYSPAMGVAEGRGAGRSERTPMCRKLHRCIAEERG